MGPFAIAVLGLTALYLTKSGVDAECSVTTTFPAPKVIGHFGSKNIITESENVIERGASQTVDLYCPKRFLYKNGNGYEYIVKGNHIKLTCNNNYFDYNGGNSVSSIQCAHTQVSELYESLSAMPDCTDMTLVFGNKFDEFRSIKNAAICYDLLGQKLKYAAYTAYPPKTRVIEHTQIGQLNSLGVDTLVDYNEGLFKEIGAEAVNDAMRNDKQFQTMFGAETFEYSNLIQDDAFAQILNEYKSMLNILWLRPLRSGNWKNFLNALKIASLNSNYDVRVGVSGTVSTPVYQNCNETRPLSIALSSDNSVTVPAFIWAHVRALQPSNNSTDDFVAIGHNSPFLTNNERAGMCKSICDEITWLKSSLFAKLQQYPIYGTVQCCRLSDVAHKLDNFPTSAELPPPPPASKVDQIPAENVREPDTDTEPEREPETEFETDY